MAASSRLSGSTSCREGGFFDKRNAADYRLEEPRSDEAWTAIEAAERFVEAVGGWLTARG